MGQLPCYMYMCNRAVCNNDLHVHGSVHVCTWLLVLNIKASSTSDGEVVLPKSGTAEWEKRALINLTIVVS